jgi:hypothetical protein
MYRRARAAGWLFAVLAALPSTAPAQSWNTPEVRVLAERAVARRTSVQADSGLRSFRARAHGFVFFLGQLGEGFNEPPRLVKSDQLALEVYWRAPGLSKQIILGRRDRRDLPTDVQYHRDHLGIVQNNFGDQIRLGEGDEVRDVPHPLGPRGPELYDYALTDSLSIELPDRAVRVYQVLVRPKEFGAPRVVGTMFVDVDAAELVRFRFSFTPAAYLDNTLEDITVVLDNGLWFGRYWLPRRQEIEIRRRTSWLDLPARGIIRGRWEIGSYAFNVDLPAGLFPPGEPEIVYAPKATRDTFAWNGALDAGIDTALGPVERADLDRVRAELSRAVADRALTGLPNMRPGFGSISDLLHVNRVEGLTPGLGLVRRFGGGRLELAAWAGYGLSDERLKYRFGLDARVGTMTLEARARREVQDIGDEPVISGVVNSFLAQELGYDFGDYVLLEQQILRVRIGGPARAVSLSAGLERAAGTPVNATPATGAYRPNPALGGPRYRVARLEFSRRIPPLGLRLSAEGGAASGSVRYLRLRAGGDLTARLGGAELGLAGWAGWGSSSLPMHRPFVMGGRGSLIGEPFRAWGGRHAAVGRLDLRFPVPFISVPLGAFGATGNRALGGPFVAAGWTGGPMRGAPWIPSQRIRVVAGAQLEMFHRMLRAEFGVGLRDGRVGLSLDIRRDLWPIL